MVSVRGKWIGSSALGLLVLTLVFLVGACSARVSSDEQEENAPKPGGADGAWPMLGGTIGRNMVSTQKSIPDDWNIQKGKEKNLKWTVKLGSMAYGGPVIAGGRIFVGTNNGSPRDPSIKGDKGVLMCFRESDGKFLWQAVHDKLPNPEENDSVNQGIISTPAVDGDRLYYLSNTSELVCADAAGDPKTGKAKILWSLDLVKDMGVYPSQATANSPLVIGDMVYTVTANGVDPSTHKVVNPKAPDFIAVNKHTGKVVWQDSSPGNKILDGQWSNPAAAEIGGVMQVIVPGGDSWLRGFEAKSGKLLWKFDCNPKKSVFKPGGRGDRNLIIATPVVHDGKVYVGVGDEPDFAAGVGHLWCIDAAKEPKNKDKDLSPVDDNFDPKAPVNKDSGLVWHFGGKVAQPEEGKREVVFGRTLSSVAVADGLVYAAELDGFLHCLDAKTGEQSWQYDLKDGTWNSAYVIAGKVIIGVNSGDLYVFDHGKMLKEPKKIDMSGDLKVPPVAVNGVLYINNGQYLYAITGK